MFRSKHLGDIVDFRVDQRPDLKRVSKHSAAHFLMNETSGNHIHDAITGMRNIYGAGGARFVYPVENAVSHTFADTTTGVVAEYENRAGVFLDTALTSGRVVMFSISAWKPTDDTQGAVSSVFDVGGFTRDPGCLIEDTEKAVNAASAQCGVGLGFPNEIGSVTLNGKERPSSSKFYSYIITFEFNQPGAFLYAYGDACGYQKYEFLNGGSGEPLVVTEWDMTGSEMGLREVDCYLMGMLLMPAGTEITERDFDDCNFFHYNQAPAGNKSAWPGWELYAA